jgi:carboxypeptidase PM20D1
MIAKRLAGILGILVVGLLVVLLVNTFRADSRQVDVGAVTPVQVDLDRVGYLLSRSIQYPTVSRTDESLMTPSAFRGLHGFLEQSFPGVHRELTRETVADLSLLYTWGGTDSGLPPILLMGHLDVVPVEDETAEGWTHPPFSGEIADGYVWGRGSMDVKMTVISVLTAIEHLLAEGFEPRRTLLLAFGHNEEVAGNGAQSVADLLESRDVRLHYVLDEGMAITEGIVPGVSAPAALIGIAEKGSATVELIVETGGGHSAMPPTHPAAGILGSAVSRLEADPFPSELRGPAREMFTFLAPEMNLPLRVLFTNLWLFNPLIESQLAAKVSTNASIRTTTAVTILESGVQANVIPSRARALVNFRILPGDSVQGVLDRVEAIAGGGELRVELRPDAREPSPVSDVASESFRTVAGTIREVFPATVVAPALVLGGTDSRHFTRLSENVYRFVPLRVGPDDLGRIHGTDERISLENLEQMVRFYVQLIRNSAG